MFGLKRIYLFTGCISLMLGALVFSGCASKQADDPGEQQQAQNQPVTVTLGVKGDGYLNDEEIKRYVTDPAAKKYPWITVERVFYSTNNKPDSLNNLVAAGQVPDIIITNNNNGFPLLQQLGLLDSIEDLIKKENMDLQRFEPQALEAIRAGTQRDDLIGIPYTRHFSALYYNQSIFDKFAVSYPKDGMTWDEATELAKRVTRKSDNIQYLGLQPDVMERPSSQLSLPYVDPSTQRAAFNSDAWKRVLRDMVEIYEIPGNDEILTKNKAITAFSTDQRLAMLPGNNIIFTAKLDKMPEFKWDMATYPVWPEAPGMGMRYDEHVMVLSKVSKHKDEAFRVISTVVSDEVQLDMAKQGRFSIMQDSKFKDAFGTNMAFMTGKNIQAINKIKPSHAAVPTEYDDIAFAAMNDAVKQIVNKGKDINTALREAEEKLNKQIQTQKGE
jgi:multiple sugar transport system substrate-binding protein